MTDARWKLKRKEKVYGPVDKETLRRWIVERRVSPEDYLSPEDEEEWIKAKFIPHFQDLFVPQAKAISPEVVKCPNCGNTLSQEVVFCVNCGTDLKTGKKIVEERKREANTFRRAAIAGILSLIVFPVVFVWGPWPPGGLGILVEIATTIPPIVFFWSFKVIGKKYSNTLLETASYFFIVILIIDAGIFIWRTIHPAPDDVLFETIDTTTQIIDGVVTTLFGASFFRLKPEFDRLVVKAGVLWTICGASSLMMTGLELPRVLLFPPPSSAPLLLLLPLFVAALVYFMTVVPSYIFSVILLFRAAKKLEPTPV
jgi:hypothetical protein